MRTIDDRIPDLTDRPATSRARPDREADFRVALGDESAPTVLC